MAISIPIDRNLTVMRSGIPADDEVQLIYRAGDQIVDVCRGPCHLVVAWFNKQRKSGCIEPGWTATIEVVKG